MSPEHGLADLSDAELFAAHRASPGDPGPFSEVVRRHKLQLWSVALQVLRDPDDASDAVQSALLFAFRSAHTYRGEASVAGWLRTIVRNASLKLIEARYRSGGEPVASPTAQDHIEAPGAVAEVTAIELRSVLREAIAQLPEVHRRAYFLVDHAGFSLATAAEHEGVPIGTIKSRLTRARARIAEHWGSLAREGNL